MEAIMLPLFFVHLCLVFLVYLYAPSDGCCLKIPLLGIKMNEFLCSAPNFS